MLIERFQTPSGLSFEIPTEWWIEAGWAAGERPSVSYRTDGTHEIIVDLRQVTPPRRELAFDFAGFKRDRLLSVMRGLHRGDCFPPLLLTTQGAEPPFKYLVADGFHRYFASCAVGAGHIFALEKGWV